MPENKQKNITVEIPEAARLSLERAFQIFQEQSEMLEKSHLELQDKLNDAHLSLEEKNKELARRINEIEQIKEKLSGILESITDAVFLLGPENEISIANKAAQELAKLLKKEGLELFEEDSFAGALNASKKVKDKEIKLETPGIRRFFMLTVMPMASKLENTSGFKVAVLKDITEYRELQERAEREDRMAALGKVAASVAHEIRNPLSAIEGFAILLKRDLKDVPASCRLATKTIYAARQLNSVVNNLLCYTRQIKPNKVFCSLNVLVNEALDFVFPMADDHKVEIILELCDDTLPLMADPVQMKQVITNIAINAVEACPIRDGGKVWIRSSQENGMAVLEIIDNGGGIPDDRKKQIFEPFFTMKEGGIGLGLSLCGKIVESHEGNIFECGNFGKGAHFIIKLKRAEAHK